VDLTGEKKGEKHGKRSRAFGFLLQKKKRGKGHWGHITGGLDMSDIFLVRGAPWEKEGKIQHNQAKKNKRSKELS